MRGSRSRTTGGSCRLRLSSAVRRARSGRTTVTSSPSSDGPNARRTGRCCRRSPVSSISPRGRSTRCPSSSQSATPDATTARTRGSAAMVSRTSAAPSPRRASTNVACGRTSSAEIPAGTPSTLMRGAPARSCINPWSLPGESTPRAPPPVVEQRVHLQVGLFELQRRRVRRVGQPRAQPAVERRLGSVARDEHAVEPQSFFSADEPVADARAQRRDRNRRASRRPRLSPRRA